MRLAITAAAIFAATSATAMDLPITGLALNTEVVGEYKVDAETTTLTATPELAYTPEAINGLELTAGMELAVYDNAGGFTLMDEFDVAPTVAFGAVFVLPQTNIELELGTAWNFDTKEREEITFTTTFNF